MKCIKCGLEDTRPIVVRDIVMRPCGKLKRDEKFLEAQIKMDCPVREWQEGYAMALMEKSSKSEDGE